MTQMMLFDAPAVSPLPVSVPASQTVAEPTARTQPKQADKNTPVSALASAPVSAPVSAPEHTPGLNHMGDLARLVILRYELAAKRRAEQAARPR